MSYRNSPEFLSWCVTKFLQKHHVKYNMRKHYSSSYFEITMPTGKIRLVRVSDHKPNRNYAWEPDLNLYTYKDYRKFKNTVKKYIKSIWLKEYENVKS